jgi:hypothetical protein
MTRALPKIQNYAIIFHIGASQNETSLWPSANFRFQHVSVSGSGEPLNVSTAYLLNVFFGPDSPIQRFNDSRHRRLNAPLARLLAREGLGSSEFRRDPVHFGLGLQIN